MNKETQNLINKNKIVTNKLIGMNTLTPDYHYVWKCIYCKKGYQEYINEMQKHLSILNYQGQTFDSATLIEAHIQKSGLDLYINAPDNIAYLNYSGEQPAIIIWQRFWVRKEKTIKKYTCECCQKTTIEDMEIIARNPHLPFYNNKRIGWGAKYSETGELLCYCKECAEEFLLDDFNEKMESPLEEARNEFIEHGWLEDSDLILDRAEEIKFERRNNVD